MASTNKTTHYELSQFLGTDKPAWLTDYNSDMNKIDTGINSAQTTATGADGKADSNTTAIGTLTNLTTDEKTSLVGAINEVDGHADTAQNTANTANSTADNAILQLNSLKAYLSLSQVASYTQANITTGYGSMGTSSVTVARNQGGTLAKIYGTIIHRPTATGDQYFTLDIDTGLRPVSDITISPCGEVTPESTNYLGIRSTTTSVSMTIKTTGKIEFKYWCGALPSNGQMNIIAFPCLYFIEDWGDEPVTP